MSHEWDIKARAEVCVTCEASFTDEQLYYSYLMYREDTYTRADVCEGCRGDTDTVGALSSWKGLFKIPPPPPEEALKKETAESLLRAFMKEESKDRLHVVYILAVMLERRRILIERAVQVRDDGVKVRVYEHRKTGETLLISDPELKLSEIELVQEEVVTLLGGKLPAKAESNEPAAQVVEMGAPA